VLKAGLQLPEVERVVGWPELRDIVLDPITMGGIEEFARTLTVLRGS
jgi:hypothetical protein